MPSVAGAEEVCTYFSHPSNLPTALHIGAEAVPSVAGAQADSMAGICGVRDCASREQGSIVLIIHNWTDRLLILGYPSRQ